MSDAGKKWIIRDTAGRIRGPYSTEKILYKIGRGEIMGDEAVAYYPGGAWIPISQDPQFYDKLLESLSEQENVIPDGTQGATQMQVGSLTGEHEQAPAPEPAPAPTAPAPAKEPRRKRPSPDIELIDTRGQLLKAIFRQGRLPIAIGLAGLIVISFFLTQGSSSEGRIHLLAPQRNQPHENAEAIKERVHQGVADFVKDTFEGYMSAQNNLVRAVEGSGKDPEVMALLCITYLQLWPYAYQDSSDLKAITWMVQLSSGIDPGGPHSSACRAVGLIADSRYSEAKSLTESMLESRANQAQTPIIFYYLKGLLLEETGDYGTAVGYLRSAEQLWPQWTRPFILDAIAEIKLERYSDAANILHHILTANPNHPVAKIELGLIEYKYFSHFDRARELLEQGVAGTAPKDTRSRGYFGLAEIALQSGSQSRALSFAQKSYSLNSSNTLAKNLIVKLGGVEKLRKTKIKGQELIFEGDQFFREGDFHSAQAYYRAAFEEDSRNNAVAAMKAAECLWQLSFSSDATSWLERAIKADPKLIEAYVLLADYEAQRFNFTAASKVLASAYKVNPKSPEVFRGLAIVELRRGNPAGAVSFGKKALQIYETDVETQILMAQAYLAMKDPKMAYNYAAKAIEIDVNHRRAQTVYAEALMGLQGVDASIDYLLRLIASYPLVVDYRLALGKIYEKDERYNEAKEVFSQVAKIQDKPKEAYLGLARVLKAENKPNPALEYLLRAAVLDPADADPLFQAGLIYLATGKGPEALAQFQRVLVINKLFPLVHYQMGRAAMMMGQPDQALEQTRQEKSVNPNLADAFLLAADAYSTMKQYSQCAGEYQKAIKIQAQPAMIYVKLATCYRKSGNVDAATDMLKHAHDLEEGLADIYKEQGAIYELKGEVQNAIEAYNQYFVLDPNAPDRMQIEQRILTLQRGAIAPQ